jgi:glycosyltransferase involved in cell wall biosynthesis
LKIAIISRELPPHGGGIGSWSLKAATGLARLRNDVHLFTENRGEEACERDVPGLHIHRVDPANLRPHSVAWALAASRAVLAQDPHDVVQACEWDAEAIVYSLRPGAPLVTRLATPHFLVQAVNQAPWHQRWRSQFTSNMERVQSRRSRALISPTRILAREVAHRWRLDASAIQVVPTGIDPPELTPAAIPDFLGEAPYILYFGRLEIRKGVDVLIDALPAIFETHRDVHCVLIGEDLTYHGVPFPEYTRQRCPGYGRRIHFLPRMEHARLFNIVANAAIVAIPSRWENLANTCLESMVLGRTIVASSGSGFDEVLTDGVDGLLVPPGDASALASAVSALLSDPARSQRLGAAARRRAADFTVDGMAARLMEVYGTVVA